MVTAGIFIIEYSAKLPENTEHIYALWGFAAFPKAMPDWTSNACIPVSSRPGIVQKLLGLVCFRGDPHAGYVKWSSGDVLAPLAVPVSR